LPILTGLIALVEIIAVSAVTEIKRVGWIEQSETQYFRIVDWVNSFTVNPANE